MRDDGLRRKDAVGMDLLVKEFIREMKLSSGINRQRAIAAWNAVSGAAGYTVDVSFDRGVMCCVIASSVVRNQLYFQRESLIARLNDFLEHDELFVRGRGDGPLVRNLILR